MRKMSRSFAWNEGTSEVGREGGREKGREGGKEGGRRKKKGKGGREGGREKGFTYVPLVLLSEAEQWRRQREKRDEEPRH